MTDPDPPAPRSDAFDDLDTLDTAALDALIHARTDQLAEALRERVARTVRLALPDAHSLHLLAPGPTRRAWSTLAVTGARGRALWTHEDAPSEPVVPARELLRLAPPDDPDGAVWDAFRSLDTDIDLYCTLRGHTLLRPGDAPYVYILVLPRPATAARDDAPRAEGPAGHTCVTTCMQRPAEIAEALGHDQLGHKTAGALIRGGYTTPRLISEAPDDELESLRDFGAGQLARARAAFPFTPGPVLPGDAPLRDSLGDDLATRLEKAGLRSVAAIREATGRELGAAVGEHDVIRVRRATRTDPDPRP